MERGLTSGPSRSGGCRLAGQGLYCGPLQTVVVGPPACTPPSQVPRHPAPPSVDPSTPLCGSPLFWLLLPGCQAQTPSPSCPTPHSHAEPHAHVCRP